MATAASVKQKIQGLIDSAGAAAGEAFADLTTAVAALIAGYGQGGDGDTMLDNLDEIYSWRKYTPEVLTETEVSNQAISYYNPSSTTDLSNYKWDTVSYADSVEITDGEIVLVNPTTFTMSSESDYSVVIGKYIQTGYDDCFYRIPEDAQMTYSKAATSTSEYIRATKAMRLSVTAEEMLGYVVSDNRNSYPDDGELDGYRYVYNGTVGANGLDTSDATATAEDLCEGETAYVNGEKIAGTLTRTGSIQVSDAAASVIFTADSSGNSATYIQLQANLGEEIGRTVVDADTTLKLQSHADNFGTAEKADVLSGKTFTSAAGLKIEGTAQLLTVVSGTTSTSTIETGLSSISSLSLYTDSIPDSGLIHMVYDGSTCHYVCCNSSGSCTANTGNYTTIEGGIFQWNGIGNAALSSDTVYSWIACGQI